MRCGLQGAGHSHKHHRRRQAMPFIQQKLISLSKIGAAALIAAGMAGAAQAQSVCNNATGNQGGYFYTHWKDGGTGCLNLGSGGNYSISYNRSGGRNLVSGKGWQTGSVNRVVGYNAGV